MHMSREEEKTASALELIRDLYESEYASMYKVAFFTLGDEALAEVAVQETFLTALRFPDKLKNSEKPVGWLYKALRYTIMHIQRDRQRVLKLNISIEELPERSLAFEDSYSVIDDETAQSEDMRLLVEFLCEGYTLQEIANKRGITLGACKMRIKRAKERLRKKLE